MANSTSEAVGTAAKAAVDALALTPQGGQPIVSVKRKSPSFPEGAAAGLPAIVVSVGEEGKSEYLTATTKLKTYPVAVTIVTNTGQQLADDVVVRQWRQQIELKLEAGATWSGGVPGFSEVDLTNRAPFDVAAIGKDFNYAIVIAEVQVVETRGAV